MPHVGDLLNEYVQRAAGVLDGSRLHANAPLAPYTTFRIGGPADLLYDATTADELANAVVLARSIGVPFFMLGTGANILVGDAGFRGEAVRRLSALAIRAPANGGRPQARATNDAVIRRGCRQPIDINR